MKVRLLKRLAILSLVGAISIGTATTASAAEKPSQNAQQQEQNADGKEVHPMDGKNEDSKEGIKDREGQKLPEESEEQSNESDSSEASSSEVPEAKEPREDQPQEKAEVNKGLKRFYEDEKDRKDFLKEEYLDTEATQNIINDVDDEDLQSALQSLLDAYEEALSNEKTALDDEDSTEETIKSLHEAVLEARDALLDALRDVNIDVDEIEEPDDDEITALLEEYDATEELPEIPDEEKAVKSGDNADKNTTEAAPKTESENTTENTDDIGALEKIKETLENALNALKSILNK